MKLKNITIVGLGLMGGSLAAACRRKFPHAVITGVSRNSAALRTALKKKWIHQASRGDLSGVCTADLVVLCTPVSALKGILKVIDLVARPGTLVTDAGSTKGEICSWAKRLKNVSFVGAHPMAGSHRHGLEAADPKLYDNRLTFVIRSGRSKADAAVKAFWKTISGRIHETDAVTHDRIAAEISHLPHAAAACLVASADPKFYPFAAGGFIDSTRIAQGDASVWVPIFLSNRKALKPVFKRFEKEFKAFQAAVASGNARKLEAFLKAAADRRTRLKP